MRLSSSNGMRKRGLFITGTDTGVGKTLVTASLAVGLQRRGFSVAVMKPVATGATLREDGTGALSLVAADTVILRNATKREEPTRVMTPYVFELPASPHLAAARAGTEIDPRLILDTFHGLAGRYPGVLVEGVGGLLVPLRDDWCVADMARCFGLPIVVVARSSLGTLNHTLLTLEAARSRGLDIAGVIFSQTERPQKPDEPWSMIERDNMATIQRLGSAEILGAIPYLSGLNDEDPVAVYEQPEKYIDWDKVVIFFNE
ncbi:MAG: dethiobiotin synthase [bacterium]